MLLFGDTVSEVISMQEKPYFCPNCCANRTKFKVITSYSQQLKKDPISGTIHDLQDAEQLVESDPAITCMVCNFTGNELRFVKQAGRDPRIVSETIEVYT